MKRLLLTPLLLSTLMLMGCPSKPDKPSALSALIQIQLEKFTADETTYDAAYIGGDLDKAQRMRNRIVDRLKNMIDSNYQEFELLLARRRSNENILFDMTELGASLAATITNGARAKTIIAAALTGFKGARKSIDQNVFRERTTEAIISKMREARAEIETQLYERMDAPVTIYSLERAYGHLIKYFFAGTLQNGLQKLGQDAGQDAVVAEENAAAAEDLRVATEPELKTAKSLRSKLRELDSDLRSSDADKQAAARTAIRSALTELGSPPAENATDQELRKALLDKFREANRSADTTLMDALKKALKVQ